MEALNRRLEARAKALIQLEQQESANYTKVGPPKLQPLRGRSRTDIGLLQALLPAHARFAAAQGPQPLYQPVAGRPRRSPYARSSQSSACVPLARSPARQVKFSLKQPLALGEAWKIVGKCPELGRMVPEVAPYMTWNTGDNCECAPRARHNQLRQMETIMRLFGTPRYGRPVGLDGVDCLGPGAFSPLLVPVGLPDVAYLAASTGTLELKVRPGTHAYKAVLR